MFVYKITNKINNKVYVGYDSVSINEQRKRWTKHRRNYNNEKAADYNKVLYRAMRKHGIENFNFEILEECSDLTILKEREIFWIALLNTTDKNFGYNSTPGGDGCYIQLLSPEQKIELYRKANETKKKNWNNLSPETKEEKVKVLRIAMEAVQENIASSWLVIDPTGQDKIVKRLRNFAIKNNLDYDLLIRTSWGSHRDHKGWKCFKLDENSNKIPPKYENPKSRSNVYSAKSPTGDIYNNIIDLKSFCDEHSISRTIMYAMASQKRNSKIGWQCVLEGESFPLPDPPKIPKKRDRRVIVKKTRTIHGLTKTWDLIDPNGHQVEVTNLKDFCKNQNLHYRSMLRVSSGERNQHKGWKILGNKLAYGVR